METQPLNKKTGTYAAANHHAHNCPYFQCDRNSINRFSYPLPDPPLRA
jgi:hypothetical protein